jgi:hypothetical protein
MTPLVLTGAIPGLLRRGSPVRVQLASDTEIAGVHQYGRVMVQDGGLADIYGIGTDSEEVAPEEVRLDLTDPLGLHTAILWLRERGHNLRWADARPDVMTWSVLSVSRGGVPIQGVRAVSDPPVYVNEAWLLNGYPFATREEADAERARVRARLLEANYALKNDDGSLTLPALSVLP